MSKPSSALMIALAVIAMFWGNCLTCPQMLSASASSHSCCPKSHQPSVKCDSQSMQQFVKAEMHAPVVLTATRLTVDVSAPTWTSTPVLVVDAPEGYATPPPTLRV